MVRPYEPLVIHNFFTEDELELIWCELKLLCRGGILREPFETGGAPAPDGGYLKQNKGILFSEFYLNIEDSPIYRASRKLFNGITRDFASMCFANNAILHTTYSTFLASYYEDGDYYLPHQDQATVTVLYWFCQEPRTFTGGDLLLHDLEEFVPFENNTMVMFPSNAVHSVSPVRMETKVPYGGRFCVTQALKYP
jgi:hypothetical protein